MDWNKVHLFEVEMIFNDLRRYQNLIEGFLSDEKKEIEKSYDRAYLEKESEKAGINKENYLVYLLDCYADRHYEIAKQFPHNFRSSFLVQVISFIETELKKMCNHFGNKTNQKFTVDDLKGSNDLDKCKIYLKSIINMDFKDFKKEWYFIKQCKLLRNKIVHHNSIIKRSDENLMSFAKNTDSIKLIDYEKHSFENIEFIIINNRLIDELLNTGEDFFQKILNKNQL